MNIHDGIVDCLTMALCRVCYRSSKLLNVLSKHKVVTTSCVGYARKGGNTFLLETLATFMQMPVFGIIRGGEVGNGPFFFTFVHLIVSNYNLQQYI